MNYSGDTIRLFSTDIEDTLLGDPRGSGDFRLAWESLGANRPLLVYNTSRSISDTQWLVLEHRMPPPDFIIGALGTEILDPVDARAAEEYRAWIKPGWDRALVGGIVDDIAGVHRQPAEFLNPCKMSWYWHLASAADLTHLRLRLEQAGLEVSVSYSGGGFLDVTPRQAGKGNALQWLCRRIGVSLPQVLVAGASGNNGSMFALPGVHGIVVGNASRELFDAAGPYRPFVAREKQAAGLLAGLRHFGVGATADAIMGWRA